MDDGTPESVAQQCLEVCYRDADADPGALVDLAAQPGLAGNLRQYLLHVVRYHQVFLVREGDTLLVHDGDFVLDGLGVMGVNLGAVAVLQWSHNAAAVGIVLRVGGGDHVHIQGQTDAVAFYLHVPLFHQVEQAHLYALCQVG